MEKVSSNVGNKKNKSVERPLSKKEQKIYNNLKRSLEDIRSWERGEIELKDARDFLKEL